MTPRQIRRLDTIAAAIFPCLGCLQEDLAEAEIYARGPSSSLLEVADRVRVAANAERLRRGEEPVEGYSAEEIEQERAHAKAVRDDALNAVHVLLATVPVGKRRTSCTSCALRKRNRESTAALAARVSKNIREQRHWEAEDEAFSLSSLDRDECDESGKPANGEGARALVTER